MGRTVSTRARNAAIAQTEASKMVRAKEKSERRRERAGDTSRHWLTPQHPSEWSSSSSSSAGAAAGAAAGASSSSEAIPAAAPAAALTAQGTR